MSTTQPKKHRHLIIIPIIILLIALITSSFFIYLYQSNIQSQNTTIQVKNTEISNLQNDLSKANLNLQGNISLMNQQISSLQQQLATLKQENSTEVLSFEQQLLNLEQENSIAIGNVTSYQEQYSELVSAIDFICLSNNGMNGVFLSDMSVGPSYQIGLDEWRNANITVNNLLGTCNVTLTFCGTNTNVVSMQAGTSQKVNLVDDLGMWSNPLQTLVITSVSR